MYKIYLFFYIVLTSLISGLLSSIQDILSHVWYIAIIHCTQQKNFVADETDDYIFMFLFQHFIHFRLISLIMLFSFILLLPVAVMPPSVSEEKVKSQALTVLIRWQGHEVGINFVDNIFTSGGMCGPRSQLQGLCWQDLDVRRQVGICWQGLGVMRQV